MPTVLRGKEKLSALCFLLRCAPSQVTRSQHSRCAKQLFKDMTQSWASQQALGGDQRILYSSKDAKQATTQQRQSRGDVQLRMGRHPHVAPHKSMLADDLKLSSDDDDNQRAIHDSLSWDRHSLSAQRALTNGRRVRHSSSNSSASDSSVESAGSSLRSRSPSRSPEVGPDPGSPVHVHPSRHNQETDHPSAAQWQLDKWLKKSQRKSTRSERDPQNVPGRLSPPVQRAGRLSPPVQRAGRLLSPPVQRAGRLSPPAQRAPSPARSWDSDQDYSPSQSPIPSPQFSYGHAHGSYPSPGYEYCPSPSPFPSTCPSPSPRRSPVPSPVPSVCPSPCGSPGVSRSPSPIPRDPPRSPSPGLPAAPLRVCPPQTQPGLTTNPHRTKPRPWIPPLPNADTKTKPSSNPHHQHRSRHRPPSDRDQNQSRPKVSAVLSSNQSQNHKSRLKPIFHSSPKDLAEVPQAKNASHPEQVQSSRSRSGSGSRSRSRSRPPSSQQSPTKRFIPSGCETSSHSQSSSRPGPNPSAGPNPGPKSRSRSLEAPTSPHVHPAKPSQKKPEAKQQEVERRRDHLSQSERRKQDRKEDRPREKVQGRRERKEDGRLAEEQLRRPWIQSSEEDEEEEEEAIEQQRRREEKSGGETRRKREQQQRLEWTKPRGLQDDSLHQGGTKRRSRTEEDRDVSPPPPPSPSPSSSSSSSSESECPVSKAPADSTSNKRPPRRGPDPATVVQPRGSGSGSPGKGHQSEGRQKLYTLVPFGRSEKAPPSSQRGLRNLVVHIDLCLLKRVPDSTTTSPVKNPPSSSSSSSSAPHKDKQREAMKHLFVPETKDNKRKRKLENGVSHRDNKRSFPYPNDVSGPTESSTLTAENLVTETTHNGYLEEYLDSKRPLSPLSPLSPLPQSPESNKSTSKTKAPEQQNTPKNKDKSRDSAIKPKTEVEFVKVSKQPQPPAETWGPAGHRGTLQNHQTPHHAEYYLHEAKRMKHRADAMVDKLGKAVNYVDAALSFVDKLGKAVNYVDAALSFMECGKAMEEGPLEAKSPYTMYSETVELIRYAMRLKSHSGPGARQEDKQLAVLCFRCLALLYWQMFRLKKDHALKYSKVLLDYFKSSPKVPTTPPGWTDSGKAAGPPSSLSPNTKHMSRGSHGGGSSSVISIPQRIHQMAANHLNITNSVLYSYEYWEVADNLAKDNKEFFNYLNTLSGPLTLHSSVSHAVQYTRQALQWIRISAKLN